MTSTNTFRIPESNLSNLEVAIKKLSAKAMKLGCEPIAMTVGAFTDFPTKEDPDIVVRYFDVTISGQTPRLNGWEFVATLERFEGEVLVSTTPRFKAEMPRSYRSHETAGDCDHCKQRRNRTETFVVRNENGEFKQVGRNCLADFLGGQDPHTMAKMAEYLWEACAIAEESETFGGGGGGSDSRVGSLVFLAHVAAAIRVNGWVSKAAAAKYAEVAYGG